MENQPKSQPQYESFDGVVQEKDDYQSHKGVVQEGYQRQEAVVNPNPETAYSGEKSRTKMRAEAMARREQAKKEEEWLKKVEQPNGDQPNEVELPPVDVVNANLDNYEEAHKAEVVEAFNQHERDQSKVDAA